MWLLFELLRSLFAIAWAKAVTTCRPLQATATSAADFARGLNAAKTQLSRLLLALALSPNTLADFGGNIGLSKQDCLTISQCRSSYLAVFALTDIMFSKSTQSKKIIKELGIGSDALLSGSPIGNYLLPCVQASGQWTSEDINIPQFRIALLLAHFTTPKKNTFTATKTLKTCGRTIAVFAALYALIGAVSHGRAAWKSDASLAGCGWAATTGAAYYGTYPIIAGPASLFSRRTGFHFRPYGRACAAFLSYEVRSANDASDTQSTTKVKCFKVGASPKCPATGVCSVATSDCTTELLREYVNASAAEPLPDSVVDNHDSTSIWHTTTHKFSLFSWSSTSCRILDLMTTSSAARLPLRQRLTASSFDWLIQAAIVLSLLILVQLTFDPLGIGNATRDPTTAVPPIGSTTWSTLHRRAPNEAATNARKETIRTALQDADGLGKFSYTSGEFLPRVSNWISALSEAATTSELARIANVAFANWNSSKEEVNALKHLHQFLPETPTSHTGGKTKVKKSYALLSNVTNGAALYLNAAHIALAVIHISVLAVANSDVSLAIVIDKGLQAGGWFAAVSTGADLQELNVILIEIAEAALAACNDAARFRGAAHDQVQHIHAAVHTFVTEAALSAQQDGKIVHTGSIKMRIRFLKEAAKKKYAAAIAACKGQ